MNRIDDVFKPFEALSSGSGKIYKTQVDGAEKFVRSSGFFSRIRHYRSKSASEKDVLTLYDRVKTLRTTEGIDPAKVEETFGKILSKLNADSNLREATKKVRESETKALERELGTLKELEAFSNEQVSSVLRARSWLESLDEPTELEDKLRTLVDEIGLQISRQFTKASSKAEKEFQGNATPEKARELLRDPLVGKVAKWQEPFTGTIFKVINAVASSKATPVRPPPSTKPPPAKKTWAPHKPSEPTGPKPEPKAASVLRRWQHNMEAKEKPKAAPKRTAVTPPPQKAKPAPKVPPPRSISNPHMSLNLHALPKNPQPRVLTHVPKATDGPCLTRHLAKADELHKNSVFKGKTTLKKEDAEKITKYIEEHKDALVKLAKESSTESVFIGRQVSDLPRSMQVSIEEGKPQFHILLKSGVSGRKDKIGILGKGGNKTVKLALDYNRSELVASASIASGKEAFEEYAKLRLFNSALAACRYVNAYQKDVTTVIFPLANRGEMSFEKFNQLTPKQKNQWCLSAAALLQKIHSSGYVSSDVKQENLLLHVDSKGVAHAVMTDHGATVERGGRFREGTKPYLPIEMTADPKAMSKHKMDPSQDIWAFGITLWKLTHGDKAPPWHPDRPFKYEGRWEKAATSTPLEELCKTMMHPDPKQRPDIETVAKELAKIEF